MPLIDEVDNGADIGTRILTRSPKENLQETIAHTQLLLGGLSKIDRLGTNRAPNVAINYGFFLHELLSITPDSPVFLFNKDIRQMLMDCSHFLQDVGNNLQNADVTNQLFHSSGRYYEQMKGAAIFISEAIGYALFSDSSARDLILGIIELQQTAFLSLILPFCDQPVVYTVLDEIVVGNKTSKLFVIIAKSLMEEFKSRVIYKCMGEHQNNDLARQKEINYVELWCSLLRSLVRNLPVTQESSPLFAILGKTLQPHFSTLLDLASSKDFQIATLVIPLITDIFTAFKLSSSLLPESVFADFNARVESFVPFLANVQSRCAEVLAHQTIEMFCAATFHPPAHSGIAYHQIFLGCLQLCFARQFDTFLGITIRFCNLIVVHKKNRFCETIQKNEVAGTLIKRMGLQNKNIEWFMLAILHILTAGDLSKIILPNIRNQIKEWATKIPPGLSSPPDSIEILMLKRELKQLQNASQALKQKAKQSSNHPHAVPHPPQSLPHLPQSSSKSPPQFKPLDFSINPNTPKPSLSTQPIPHIPSIHLAQPNPATQPLTTQPTPYPSPPTHPEPTHPTQHLQPDHHGHSIHQLPEPFHFLSQPSHFSQSAPFVRSHSFPTNPQLSPNPPSQKAHELSPNVPPQTKLSNSAPETPKTESPQQVAHLHPQPPNLPPQTTVSNSPPLPNNVPPQTESIPQAAHTHPQPPTSSLTKNLNSPQIDTLHTHPKPPNSYSPTKNPNFSQRTNSLTAPHTQPKTQPAPQAKKHPKNEPYIPPHHRSNPYDPLLSIHDNDLEIEIDVKANEKRTNKKKLLKDSKQTQKESEAKTELEPDPNAELEEPKESEEPEPGTEAHELEKEMEEEGDGANRGGKSKKKDSKISHAGEQEQDKEGKSKKKKSKKEQKGAKPEPNLESELGNVDGEPNNKEGKGKRKKNKNKQHEPTPEIVSENEQETQTEEELANNSEQEQEIESEPETEKKKSTKKKDKKNRKNKKQSESVQQNSGGGVIETLMSFGSSLLQRV